jgi:hypothetical protein
LTCRETRIPASQRLNITNPIDAMNIDSAVAKRLVDFDTDQEVAKARLLAYEVTKMMFGGGESDTPSGVDDSEAEVW